MKACRLTIATTVDGTKTEISRDGCFEVAPLFAKLQYREENAEVSLVLENGVVQIQRTGDYTLRLTLQEGETNEGTLGINGSEGILQVKTKRVAYTTTENSLLLSLHYGLLMGEEVQEMKLRLFAREK